MTPADKAHLKTIEQRLLWLACWMIHNANHLDTLKSPVCFLASGDGRAFAVAMRVGPLPGLWFGMWFRRGWAMPRRPCAPGTRAVSG